MAYPLEVTVAIDDSLNKLRPRARTGRPVNGAGGSPLRYRPRSEEEQVKGDPDTRASLELAAHYLAARRRCSVQEARRWIHQEARAKKATLREVALAVLARRNVHYHHDVPI